MVVTIIRRSPDFVTFCRRKQSFFLFLLDSPYVVLYNISVLVNYYTAKVQLFSILSRKK